MRDDVSHVLVSSGQPAHFTWYSVRLPFWRFWRISSTSYTSGSSPISSTAVALRNTGFGGGSSESKAKSRSVTEPFLIAYVK